MLRIGKEKGSRLSDTGASPRAWPPTDNDYGRRGGVAPARPIATEAPSSDDSYDELGYYKKPMLPARPRSPSPRPRRGQQTQKSPSPQVPPRRWPPQRSVSPPLRTLAPAYNSAFTSSSPLRGRDQQHRLRTAEPVTAEETPRSVQSFMEEAARQAAPTDSRAWKKKRQPASDDAQASTSSNGVLLAAAVAVCTFVAGGMAGKYLLK